MATLPIFDTAPDVRGYDSDRVFDGVRKLDRHAAARHRARLLSALEKSQKSL